MIFYYLDSSAWVKRYYSEPGTPELQAVFAQGTRLASASLGVIEVVAALSAKHRAGEIGSSELDQSLQDMEDDWGGFVQVRLSDETVEKARDLARDKALRGADAVHLASAVMLLESFQEPGDRLVFVVSDHRLREAALAEAASWPDMTVWDPCDASTAQHP